MRKRIFRRINKNKIKLLMLFLMIFITTTLFVGYYIGTSSVLETINSFNDINKLESGIIMLADDEEEQLSIEKMRYIDVEYEEATIRVFEERISINKHQVIEGEDLNAYNDILIDNNFMKAHGLEIGNKIILDNTEFNICGIGITPDYIMTKKSDLILQPNANVFGIALINKDSFERLNGEIQTYFSYNNDLSLETNILKSMPLFIKDTANNSRVKQVIGDATSPQILSVVVVTIFFIITIILMAVYHFENAKAEKNNIFLLSNLGISRRTILFHYIKDILYIGNIAVMIGCIAGIRILPIIMNMNNSIYNYPILNVSHIKLIFVIVLAFLLLNLSNFFVVNLCYLNSSEGLKRKVSGSMNRLKIIPFPQRYRLIYMIRNKKESVLFILLILMTGVLINFCFLLRISVVEYVSDLGKETKYNYLYFFDNNLALIPPESEGFKLYNLYDEEGIIQNVYMTKNESTYFPMGESTVVVTEAFSQKYGYDINDEIILRDIINSLEYKFFVEAISDTTTVSEIYINEKYVSLNERTLYQYGVVTDKESKYLGDKSNVIITKQEIITSGRNILSIIDKQITMVLIISIIIEMTLMYSLMSFIYTNSINAIRVFKLNGYSTRELVIMYFGYNNIITIILIAISFYIARAVTRIFLDNIMFTFVNYVEISDNASLILLSNVMILLVYAIFFYKIKLRIKRG